MMSISHRLIRWQSCLLVNSLCSNINHWFDPIQSDWFYQLDQVYQFNLSLMFIMVNPTLAADGKMLNDQPEFIISFKSITSQINQPWSNHNIGDRCLDRWTPVKSNQNQIYSINQVVNQNVYTWSHEQSDERHDTMLCHLLIDLNNTCVWYCQQHAFNLSMTTCLIHQWSIDSISTYPRRIWNLIANQYHLFESLSSDWWMPMGDRSDPFNQHRWYIQINPIDGSLETMDGIPKSMEDSICIRLRHRLRVWLMNEVELNHSTRWSSGSISIWIHLIFVAILSL